MWLRGVMHVGASVGMTALLYSTAHAQIWGLTKDSVVSFDIKTVGLTVVQGVSDEAQARLYFDINQPKTASVTVTLSSNSLQFNPPVLRQMILSEQFFDATQYKTMSFKSTEFVPIDADYYNVYGSITLRGITKPTVFMALLKPNATNPKLLDVNAVGSINRSDFGMKKAYGGVGEKVNIRLKGHLQAK